MPFPTITEKHGALICGWPQVLAPGRPVSADWHGPASEDMDEDPGRLAGLNLPGLTSDIPAGAPSRTPDSTVTPEEVPGGVSVDH